MFWYEIYCYCYRWRLLLPQKNKNKAKQTNETNKSLIKCGKMKLVINNSESVEIGHALLLPPSICHKWHSHKHTTHKTVKKKSNGARFCSVTVFRVIPCDILVPLLPKDSPPVFLPPPCLSSLLCFCLLLCKHTHRSKRVVRVGRGFREVLDWKSRLPRARLLFAFHTKSIHRKTLNHGRERLIFGISQTHRHRERVVTWETWW